CWNLHLLHAEPYQSTGRIPSAAPFTESRGPSAGPPRASFGLSARGPSAGSLARSRGGSARSSAGRGLGSLTRRGGTTDDVIRPRGAHAEGRRPAASGGRRGDA